MVSAMSDDIVARLRANSHYSINWELIEKAADEIERLREQLRLANIDAFQLAAENDTMRAERDEARREVCQWSANKIKETAQDVARRHGWNCFELKQT